MNKQNQNIINNDFIYDEKSNSDRNKLKDEKKVLKKKKLKKIIIAGVVIILSLGIIITLAVIFIPVQKPPPSPDTTTPQITIVPVVKLTGEKGYSFKSVIGQLNTIFINQKFTETTMKNGKNMTVFLDRKSIYNIYVISEKEPSEDKKHLYSKMYTCAVSIAAECMNNTNENCEPRKILGLVDESIPEGSKFRNLQENEKLEEIPIPFCLFNITDHNTITSITCPKSMPERKIKGIVLDLYFFRPPGVKRVEKEKNNITITIQDLEDGKSVIREINGGPCEDESGFYSFCSTDFNATKDSEGNLLSYDEMCYSNIIDNEQNYYIKNKITHLIDISDKNDISKAILYKEKMDKLLEIVNPYMKYNEQVSDKQFEEIYDITIKGKYPEKKKRKLVEEKKNFIKKEKIFEYKDFDGATIDITMEDDSSLNTKSFKANSYLKFNDEENEKILVNNDQQSVLTDLLDNLIILSKAGNHMGNELYQNIKNSLKELIEEIQLKISNLNNLLVYQNLTKIFDTSLDLDDLEKLPFEIIGESTFLYNDIKALLTDLNSFNTKEKFNIINKNIKDFISESYNLVHIISDNLNNLGNSMNSEGNKLSEISMYYLKKETSKYMRVVLQAQEILENYYKKEANLIKSNISSIIEEFENNLIKSSYNEKKMITDLYKNIENKTFFIENITDEICQKTVDNLSNSTIFINDISEKIKDLINKELDLKGDYFLSESDININNISFTGSIIKAREIADKLDNDKFIDKKFDEIMSYFRQIFSKILISISTDKENMFNIEEEPLKNTLFKNNEASNIKRKFNSFSAKAINEIKNENDKYKSSINATIINFLNENQEELNSLISDLYIVFSNETLKELANLYDLGMKNFFSTKEDIIFNENLIKQYFEDMKNVKKDDDYIITLLKSFQQDSIHIPSAIGSYKFKYFIDSITEKKITKAYQEKYNRFKANINYSKDYINNQLYLDLINTYKNLIIKVRKAFQSIKNNKLSDKYPDFPEIGFKIHKQIIDILFNRLDLFFSDQKYNDKYIDSISEYKSSEIKILDEISNYIEESNNIISQQVTVHDYASDYCVQFFRQKYYMCSNRQWKYPSYSDNYCVPVSGISNNYLNLKEISINYDKNLISFNNKFNELFNIINEKISIYNSKINLLKSNLLNIENEIINKKNVFDYISSFEDELNEILNKNYGDKIIKNSYDYYKNKIDLNIGKLLNKSTNYWIDAYETLEEKLIENKNNINTSISEFGTMALLYNSTITQNISKSIYNSIIIHHRNEVNYTISYYYNFLLRLANSTHNYLINRILINQNYPSYIIEKRINLINDLFYSLMNNITLYEKEALKIDNQLNILMVEEKNFFKTNNILEDNILYTTECLTQKYTDIRKVKNNIKSDQYSMTARFYLENIICGKEIETLYKQINEGTFIEMNKEKFKEIIINNNWIFNFDEFTNELEVKLYYLEKEINEEFLKYKNKYNKILEEEVLYQFFTKERIIEKVNELYNKEIIKIDNNMRNRILNILKDILNKINNHFSNEIKRLNDKAAFYNDNTDQITNTINNYKQEILIKLNKTFYLVAEDFYKNIYKNFYEDYISECLDAFYEQLKDPALNPEYILLNSTYNFNDIINNILVNLKKDYKTITKKQIIYKQNKLLIDIYNILNIDDIRTIINNEINSEFNNLLLTIKDKSINNAGYNAYNFDNQIMNDISQTINTKMNEIETIINSTKGENYQIDIKNWTDWKQQNEFDFTRINDEIDVKVNIINIKIKDEFENFIKEKKKYERESIDNLLEEAIKNNFNNLLSYLIPSFGKLFFERIIKYNENFKISNLYDNLRFSVTETLSYYITLTSLNSMTALPKDLKINLYNLNNLNSIVENYNTEILKKINNKVNDFIEYIQNYTLTQYLQTFNEFYIEAKFNDNITSLIKPKIYQLNAFLVKIFKNYSDFYFKEPFVKSYQNVLNEKTKEMIIFANNQKEVLRQQIFDKLTIDSENILNNINENVNRTEKSIIDYQNHFNTFKINTELIKYINNYYDNNIHEKFSNLIALVNDAKSNNKNNLLETLEKSSEKYENLFNLQEIIDNSNDIDLFFKETYIQNITENIEKYDANNYKEKLKKKKMEYNKRNLRHLEGNETREDIENTYYEKLADKALGKIFQTILNASNLLKDFIDGGNEFDKLDEKILNLEKDLNNDYEKSLNIIINKKEKGIFDDELYENFTERLMELKNKTKDYYLQTYQKYNNIREYLNESIYNIDKSLIQCFKATNEAFNEEYEIIKNEFIPLLVNKSINDEENNYYNFPFNTQNNGNIEYNIIVNSNKSAYFSLDLEFEGIELNHPTVTAKIINLSGPKDMLIEILSGTSDCRNTKKVIKANFNEANYTMLIKYNTESENINITNIIHVKDYFYNIKQYKIIVVEAEDEFIEINGIITNIGKLKDDECIEELQDNENVKVDEKNNNTIFLL